MRSRPKINWDALGISTSLACAIHCALLPLFVTSLPVFGINIIENIRFEFLMALVALVIGVYSLYHGKKKHHHSWKPIVIFTAGIILLMGRILRHEWNMVLLLPAVAAIIYAHYLNYRLCRAHNHAHEEDCAH
jgi:uncharacterized membrane protein